VAVTDAELLSAAIVVWTGWGRTSWPARDERLVAEAFGAERAPVLLTEIRRLEDDFYSSDARFTSGDLLEMEERATVQFQSRHPELSEEAVGALAWCYTYDYK
jgi:hypothetical protein